MLSIDNLMLEFFNDRRKKCKEHMFKMLNLKQLTFIIFHLKSFILRKMNKPQNGGNVPLPQKEREECAAKFMTSDKETTSNLIGLKY